MPKTVPELQAEIDRMRVDYDRLRDYVFGSEDDKGVAPALMEFGLRLAQVEVAVRMIPDLQEKVLSLQHDKKILSWILGLCYAIILPIAIKLISLALGL